MNKPVLILEHQKTENLAYLGTFLEKYEIPHVVYNADVDKVFPSSIEPYSALAVMGGAMSANDPLHTNRQAEILILQAILNDIPVIGHCLGGQLMAKALGGTITKSYKPEIGWQPIEFIEDQETINWFGSTPTSHVIHWHYDSFSIPKGAKLLASSPACKNQAFSYGKHLAMQFHIEIDEEKTVRWANDSDDLWIEAQTQYDTVQSKQEILNGIEPNIIQHKKTADIIYSNWLRTTEYAQHILR